MFGESNAFNLNSNVYSKSAPGIYLSVRYSTTKKAAADLPTVVGSMVGKGVYYVLCVLGGIGVGAGGMILLQKFTKKKEEEAAEEAAEDTKNETADESTQS